MNSLKRYKILIWLFPAIIFYIKQSTIWYHYIFRIIYQILGSVYQNSVGTNQDGFKSQQHVINIVGRNCYKVGDLLMGAGVTITGHSLYFFRYVSNCSPVLTLNLSKCWQLLWSNQCSFCINVCLLSLRNTQDKNNSLYSVTCKMSRLEPNVVHCDSCRRTMSGCMNIPCAFSELWFIAL